jgi:acyl transferase domain-containing protein/NADPH:quinone reductase-like Zn-dependent oxidoreductase/NAD(P)-dependent dehydrogenase (short-subunit alcohol dehydrogenase family)
MSKTDRIADLTPLQRAFLALENAEARLAAVSRAAHEPIAVIGLGCRVPGGGHDAASFWQLMHDGIDAITPIPAERWDQAALYDPDPAVPGRIAAGAGGFLRNVDEFDPGFFGIAPREAEGMDPQQRLLLEVSWEALENAGQAPDRLQDSATGVYMAACSSDYAYLQLKSGDTGLLDAHFTSGIAHSVFSGRLSFLLGLRGPSLTIDTACSSSLVAIHLACQALRNTECSMALAGGVNLILAPDLFVALSHSRMLAPDGRCKTFAAAADGFARGEGCGVVVLKRLSAAQTDGDRVLAVISGSAVNQDGPSSSLTAPNGPAQEAVIRAALAFANIAPGQVGFIEAHGTGTQLGDPLEVQALGAVFGKDRPTDRPLLIGSVKTNVGHLEAAAGVTGLIKIVLALQNRTIPPHLHFDAPSPHIAWRDLPLQVAVQPVCWEPIGGRRIAGVSSFGFSGTNAHVILEEPPARAAPSASSTRRAHLLAVSARDRKALGELAEQYADTLAEMTGVELADVCHTANSGRAHFEHRATIVASTMDETLAGLRSLGRGEPSRAVKTASIARRDPLRIAFLFTGQGAQYPGMAKGLYDASEVFRQALDRCAAILAPQLDRPLLDVLFPSDPKFALIDETQYTQPALFSVEYALTELWRAWGVMPNILIGHSVGEYVAACIAGVFSLEDGLRLVALRGRLMQSLPSGGSMAALLAGEEEVAGAVAPYAGQVSIAGINGPRQTVVSGSATAVAQICRTLGERGIQHRLLPVSHAFHSPLVAPILDQFETAVGTVNLAPPRLRLVSNLTGRPVVADEITRPEYWRRHMREAVRFGDGLRALEAARVDCCIEIGPAPALLPLVGSALALAPSRLVPSLRKGRPDWEQMLDSLSAVYLAGHQVDWRALSDGARRIVDLPTYPFQRQRHWFRAKPNTSVAAPPTSHGRHTLLGSRLRSAAPGTIFESRISADVPGFVRQHRVLDHVILPATAYLDVLVAGASDVLGVGVVCIEDVAISAAMLLDDDGGARIVQTIFEPVSEGTASVSVNSLSETDSDSAPWIRHVAARIRSSGPATLASDTFTSDTLTSDTLADLRKRCDVPVDVSEFYRDFAACGLQFGDDFHSVQLIWRDAGQALGEIALSPALAEQASRCRLHPVLLDGCLQIIAAALPGADNTSVLHLPIAIGSYTLHRDAGDRCWSHVVVQPASGGLRAQVRVFDGEGALVAEMRDVRLARVTRDALGRADERWLDACLYETRWRLASDVHKSGAERQSGTDAVRSRSREWLIFADRTEVAEALAVRVQAAGDRCTLVHPGQFAIGAEVCSIDPAKPEDYRRLLAALRSAGSAVDGVIHAWSLDNVGWDGMTAADLAEAQTRSATSPMLLAQSLVAEALPPQLWLVTRGGQQADANERSVSPIQAAAWGLGKSIAIEHPELRCVCVDLDPSPQVAECDALAAELAEAGSEGQVALRSDGRRLARLVHVPRGGEADTAEALSAAWRLVPTLPGTLERFEFEPAERRAPGPGEVEIAVEAAGINFKDVLKLLGMGVGGGDLVGGECAGRVTAVGPGVTHLAPGDSVMAIATGCFASFVIANANLVQPLPPGMSAQEGAAFPIAFLTAEFCLSHMAGMRAGDRVLIHAGAGGVGMASIRLAQRAGAEVFATAGSAWKRALLRSMGVLHVLDSRSTGFADEIMALTDGRGVDLVLNSLTGPLMDASFRVLARGGRFVEIGKRDLRSPESVAALGRDLRYMIVDWSEDAATNPALIGGMLARLVDELRRGLITSLPRQVFAMEDAARAFRLMAQARHVGKIVLRHGGATPAQIRRDGTYLVTGGLSGLGLQVARFLAERGAGRIALIGRRGMTSEAVAVVDQLRSTGTCVLTEAVDVTDDAGLSDLLIRLRRDGPPLRGVVHCAAVLDDGGLQQQDPHRLARVLGPKVHGAWLLDKLTRADPLDWFVMFSSAAAVLGSPGQTNYAAANAVLDLLAHERRNRGLCALSINWGAWAEIGVAGARDIGDRLAAHGLTGLTPAQGIAALERVLCWPGAQISVLPIDWGRYTAHVGSGDAPRFLAEVAGAATVGRPLATTGVAASVVDVCKQLVDAPATRRRSMVAEFVSDSARRILGIDPARALDPLTPLGEIGLDSLLAVELRNSLAAALSRPLPATLLFDYPTIDALTNYIFDDVLQLAARSGQIDSEAAVVAEFDLVGSVERLSDDEVDQMLATRRRKDI